jgi:hypothetical protein
MCKLLIQIIQQRSQQLFSMMSSFALTNAANNNNNNNGNSIRNINMTNRYYNKNINNNNNNNMTDRSINNSINAPSYYEFQSNLNTLLVAIRTCINLSIFPTQTNFMNQIGLFQIIKYIFMNLNLICQHLKSLNTNSNYCSNNYNNNTYNNNTSNNNNTYNNNNNNNNYNNNNTNTNNNNNTYNNDYYNNNNTNINNNNMKLTQRINETIESELSQLLLYLLINVTDKRNLPLESLEVYIYDVIV